MAQINAVNELYCFIQVKGLFCLILR